MAGCVSAPLLVPSLCLGQEGRGRIAAWRRDADPRTTADRVIVVAYGTGLPYAGLF